MSHEYSCVVGSHISDEEAKRNPFWEKVLNCRYRQPTGSSMFGRTIYQCHHPACQTEYKSPKINNPSEIILFGFYQKYASFCEHADDKNIELGNPSEFIIPGEYK